MIQPNNKLGVFAWKRILLAIAGILVLNGVGRWFTTPKEEDPRLPAREGIVLIVSPGSNASDIERIVVKPVEDELAKIEEIKEVRTRMQNDLSFYNVKLKDTVTHAQLEMTWDKVQRALDRAQAKFPETVWKPQLNREIFDQDSVFIALHGKKDKLALYDQAKLLKDKIQLHPMVKAVNEIGSPGEQLSVILDYKKLAKKGVSIGNLVAQLRGANANIPSGYVRMDDRRINVLTNSFYRTAEELKKFPIVLKSSETIPLSEVATIARTVNLPVRDSMLYNGNEATGLGVIAQSRVNFEMFGEGVRKIIKDFQETESFKKSGIQIHEISYQPHYVEERTREIALDLVKAIILVGGALMFMLGIRAGSIVAIQVPLVTAIAFGIFSQLGGILNQISIAAFILAIGLLVDNVVVIVDGIQSKLDEGMDPIEAGEKTRKEYLIPLLAGTLATIAAFLPMLIAQGNVADFTRDIGVVSTIALGASYLFCIFITPILAAQMLRKGKSRQWHFVTPLGERLGRYVKNHPKLITLSAFIAVALAVGGMGFVKQQFFPYADRNLLVVDIRLPEGTHYEAAKITAKAVEEKIRKDSRVTSVTSMIGQAVPSFYYNLPRDPNSPGLIQLVVKTTTTKTAKLFKKEREEELSAMVPNGTVIVRELSQGPPLKAPIEVQIFSDDPAKLILATQKALKLVRAAEGVVHVRSTLGVGAMDYKLDVNDSAAGLYGLTRAEVSAVVLSQTTGIPVTTFRGGRDPYAITLLSNQNENTKLADLESSYLGSTRTDDLSIKTLAKGHFQYSPSVLHHMNRVPVVYIYGEIASDSSENVSTTNALKQLEKMEKIDGVKIEMGGSMKEAQSAQKVIFSALPIAMFLLFISLMYEFNSFRRIGIILLTIPLCIVGSVPGLILTQSTFGFMTLLGIFALAGTVIHNGIFLIDYIDHRRRDGISLDQAITEGIQRRMRPIILTAVATMVELIPMTMTSSTLWPPFAWVIISGLLVSTLMTLIVIPSVFKLTFQKEEKI